MIIGRCVDYNEDTFLLGSVYEAIKYKSNTFMFYTGNPKRSQRIEVPSANIEKAKQLMSDYDIDVNNVIIHAPFIMNIATDDVLKREFYIEFLISELKRCENFSIKNLVVHAGNSMKLSKKDALNNVVSLLKEVLYEDIDCNILIEFMAGKGSELGSNIEELAYIINNVDNDKLKICLDTCHMHDASIDLKYFDEFLEEFDKLIGINKIGCIHINDSMNIRGSKKDRHANIGFGEIGFKTIADIVHNEKLKHVPKILETPIKDDDTNIEEIENLINHKKTTI